MNIGEKAICRIGIYSGCECEIIRESENEMYLVRYDYDDAEKLVPKEYLDKI